MWLVFLNKHLKKLKKVLQKILQEIFLQSTFTIKKLYVLNNKLISCR